MFSQNPDVAISEIENSMGDKDSTINWFSIAEMATSKATNELVPISRDERLRWAEIATLIRVYLINSKPEHAESHQYSDILMRLQLMHEYGLVEGHKVLDPTFIVQWFKQHQSQSLAEVHQLISDNEFDGKKILHLRHLVRRIQRLIDLQTLGYELPLDLKEWLEIFPLIKEALRNAKAKFID